MGSQQPDPLEDPNAGNCNPHAMARAMSRNTSLLLLQRPPTNRAAAWCLDQSARPYVKCHCPLRGNDGDVDHEHFRGACSPAARLRLCMRKRPKEMASKMIRRPRECHSGATSFASARGVKASGRLSINHPQMFVGRVTKPSIPHTTSHSPAPIMSIMNSKKKSPN